MSFISDKIPDIKLDEDPDIILLYDKLNKLDIRKILDDLTNLIDQDGIILIDQPKNSDKSKSKQYLLDQAADKHKIRIRHFDKRDTDLYVITREDASFNIKSGPLKIPPAERWY